MLLLEAGIVAIMAVVIVSAERAGVAVAGKVAADAAEAVRALAVAVAVADVQAIVICLLALAAEVRGTVPQPCLFTYVPACLRAATFCCFSALRASRRAFRSSANACALFPSCSVLVFVSVSACACLGFGFFSSRFSSGLTCFFPTFFAGLVFLVCCGAEEEEEGAPGSLLFSSADAICVVVVTAVVVAVPVVAAVAVADTVAATEADDDEEEEDEEAEAGGGSERISRTICAPSLANERHSITARTRTGLRRRR